MKILFIFMLGFSLSFGKLTAEESFKLWLSQLATGNKEERTTASTKLRLLIRSKPNQCAIELADAFLDLKMPYKEEDSIWEAVALGKVIREVGITKNRVFVIPVIGITESTSDPYLRHACCFALGSLGDPHSVSVLEQLLSEKDEGVRANAVWALGQIGKAETLLSRPHLLEDKDPRVVWEFAKVLVGHYKIESELFPSEYAHFAELLSKDELKSMAYAKLISDLKSRLNEEK